MNEFLVNLLHCLRSASLSLCLSFSNFLCVCVFPCRVSISWCGRLFGWSTLMVLVCCGQLKLQPAPHTTTILTNTWPWRMNRSQQYFLHCTINEYNVCKSYSNSNKSCSNNVIKCNEWVGNVCLVAAWKKLLSKLKFGYSIRANSREKKTENNSIAM